MLRRSRVFSFADVPLCVRVHSAALTWDFPDAESFHKGRPGYLLDLYAKTSKDAPFSKVIKYQRKERTVDASGKHETTVGGYRYVIAAPVTIGNVCKRVPFLIDTGAPKTHLHSVTFDKFLGKDADISHEVLRNVLIGHHKMENGVLVNTATTQKGTVDVPAWLGYLNLLGSDFLSVALPGLEEFFSENLSKFQPPLDEVIVTDGTVSLPVKPEKPTVMHLKDAIKAKRTPELDHIAADRIVIIHPETKEKMGDEDELHANLKYIFEIPNYLGVSPSELVVWSGTVSLPVKSEKPTVMHLKDAIKAKLAPKLDHIAAADIVIKHPETKEKMGDEDELHANLEYRCEIPTK